MNDWKLIAAVVGGSMLLLVLAVVGFGKIGGSGQENGNVVTREVQGEQRLVKGPEDAKVTVYEFSDFQCPACAATEPVVQQILAKENVRFVYRHFPLSTIHKNAQIGAEAAEAAYVQGKFWEMHDLLFERQSEWSEMNDPTEKLVSYAEELGLDKDMFASELKSKTYRDVVLADVQEGNRIGVNATPSFFVNGQSANSGTVLGLIDSELAK